MVNINLCKLGISLIKEKTNKTMKACTHFRIISIASKTGNTSWFHEPLPAQLCCT